MGTHQFFIVPLPKSWQKKWLEIFNLKDTNGKGAKVPTTGDDAEKYKAKWTDSKTGQIRFGGWNAEAYDRLEALKTIVEDFRKKDAANSNAGHIYALELMRKHHKITESAPGKKTKKKKKRKEAPTVDKSKRKLKRLKE